jgi:hypothetical protein
MHPTAHACKPRACNVHQSPQSSMCTCVCCIICMGSQILCLVNECASSGQQLGGTCAGDGAPSGGQLGQPVSEKQISAHTIAAPHLDMFGSAGVLRSSCMRSRFTPKGRAVLPGASSSRQPMLAHVRTDRHHCDDGVFVHGLCLLTHPVRAGRDRCLPPLHPCRAATARNAIAMCHLSPPLHTAVSY